MVTTPSVSADLAKTAQADPADRARAISQELLSLPVIAQVRARKRAADGHRTTKTSSPASAPAPTVSLPLKTLVARGDPDTFVVSYAGPTADEAQRVTNRLLKVFIERDAVNRRSREPRKRPRFLGEQLRDSERRMDEVEARLRRLKESNTGLLPDQALANLQAMSDIRAAQRQQRRGAARRARSAGRRRAAARGGPQRGQLRHPHRGRGQGRRSAS